MYARLLLLVRSAAYLNSLSDAPFACKVLVPLLRQLEMVVGTLLVKSWLASGYASQRENLCALVELHYAARHWCQGLRWPILASVGSHQRYDTAFDDDGPTGWSRCHRVDERSNEGLRIQVGGDDGL